MVTATGDWLVTRVSVATNTSLERGGAVVVHHHHVALRVGVVRLVRAHRRVHPEGVHAVVRQPGGVEERRVVLAHLGYRVVQGHVRQVVAHVALLPPNTHTGSDIIAQPELA
eukprot:947995-Prorocentrum_minimum.AAC.2